MSCSGWKEMLIDLLAQELGDEDAVLLEQHLAECTRCQAEERALRRILVRDEVRESWRPDPALIENLLGRLHRAGPRPLKESSTARSSRGRTTSTGWLRRLVGGLGLALRRPLPSYAVLALALASVGAGFWMGSAGRSPTVTGSEESVRPPTVPDTPPLVRTPGSLAPGMAVEGGPTFAEASAPSGRASWPLSFVTVQSDAMPVVSTGSGHRP